MAICGPDVYISLLDTGANSLCGFTKTSEAKIKNTIRTFRPPNVCYKPLLHMLSVWFYSPINFVHETKDRWVYAAVFGAKSGTFVQLVFNGALVSPQGYIDGILRGTCICYKS